MQSKQSTANSSRVLLKPSHYFLPLGKQSRVLTDDAMCESAGPPLPPTPTSQVGLILGSELVFIFGSCTIRLEPKGGSTSEADLKEAGSFRSLMILSCFFLFCLFDYVSFSIYLEFNLSRLLI